MGSRRVNAPPHRHVIQLVCLLTNINCVPTLWEPLLRSQGTNRNNMESWPQGALCTRAGGALPCPEPREIKAGLGPGENLLHCCGQRAGVGGPMPQAGRWACVGWMHCPLSDPPKGKGARCWEHLAHTPGVSFSPGCALSCLSIPPCSQHGMLVRVHVEDRGRDPELTAATPRWSRAEALLLKNFKGGPK